VLLRAEGLLGVYKDSVAYNVTHCILRLPPYETMVSPVSLSPMCAENVPLRRLSVSYCLVRSFSVAESPASCERVYWK
jgi:hypothetical protein